MWKLPTTLSCVCVCVTVQRLQEECQWLTVVEYVRALMQKKLICRSDEERQLLAQQMVQDAQQLREHFQSMVKISDAYCILHNNGLQTRKISHHNLWQRGTCSVFIPDEQYDLVFSSLKLLYLWLFDYVRWWVGCKWTMQLQSSWDTETQQ